MTSTSLLPLASQQPRLAYPHNRRGEPRPLRNKLGDALAAFARQRNRSLESLRYEDTMACITEIGLPAIPDAVLPNAAASMVTSAADYARFLAAAIPNHTLRQPHSHIRKGGNFTIGWGLGWGIETVANRTYLWQWGDNGGYKNIVFAEPERGDAVFVFTNSDAGARVYERILAHLAGFEHPALFGI